MKQIPAWEANNRFPTFDEIQSSITVFTRAQHLSQMNPIRVLMPYFLKVKVKSLWLTKHHAMEAYWGVEV
jgi:hypothetical protein